MFDKRHTVPYNNSGDIYMNEIRKGKLLNYLYPREEIAEFMIGDFYAELSLVLDKKICFSPVNSKNAVRESNFILATDIIKDFLQKNTQYKDRVLKYYGTNYDILIENILYGYVLIVSSHINRGKGADIFWDRRSVCYKKGLILEVLDAI